MLVTRTLSPCSVFLAEQFELLQPYLDTMMPPAKKPFLQQFYSQVSLLQLYLWICPFLSPSSKTFQLSYSLCVWPGGGVSRGAASVHGNSARHRGFELLLPSLVLIVPSHWDDKYIRFSGHSFSPVFN